VFKLLPLRKESVTLKNVQKPVLIQGVLLEKRQDPVVIFCASCPQGNGR